MQSPSEASTLLPRCGALIESLGDTPAPIVVERAMYADAPRQHWASGTNVLATRLK